MRILHLPVNISSQISCTVRALRTLGVEVRGLVRHSSLLQDCTALETVDWTGNVNSLSRFIRGVRWRWKLLRRIAWADLIHWHWGDTTWKGLDLRWAARLRKPRLVEFWGDDLRDPTIASADNSFARAMYRQDPARATDRGANAQALFSHHGFECLIPGYELMDYLRPQCYSGYYQTRPRLSVEDYVPKFPEATKRRPLLVHAPSHKGVKGTEAVLAAMTKLGGGSSFDFKLIHDMPRNEALAIVSACDIFLDQFVLGCEGLAAHEAMAMGKPVICFIKPSLLPRYPSSLPVIGADQHTLAKTVADLIENPLLRREVGIRSRQYIEQYHDARKVARELLDIYADVIAATEASAQGKPVLRNHHWHKMKPGRPGEGGS